MSSTQKRVVPRIPVENLLRSLQNPNIGKRTGVDVRSGKNIRHHPSGAEVYDDYFTESEREMSVSGIMDSDNSTLQLNASSRSPAATPRRSSRGAAKPKSTEKQNQTRSDALHPKRHRLSYSPDDECSDAENQETLFNRRNEYAKALLRGPLFTSFQELQKSNREPSGFQDVPSDDLEREDLDGLSKNLSRNVAKSKGSAATQSPNKNTPEKQSVQNKQSPSRSKPNSASKSSPIRGQRQDQEDASDSIVSPSNKRNNLNQIREDRNSDKKHASGSEHQRHKQEMSQRKRKSSLYNLDTDSEDESEAEDENEAPLKHPGQLNRNKQSLFRSKLNISAKSSPNRDKRQVRENVPGSGASPSNKSKNSSQIEEDERSNSKRNQKRVSESEIREDKWETSGRKRKSSLYNVGTDSEDESEAEDKNEAPLKHPGQFNQSKQSLSRSKLNSTSKSSPNRDRRQVRENIPGSGASPSNKRKNSSQIRDGYSSSGKNRKHSSESEHRERKQETSQRKRKSSLFPHDDEERDSEMQSENEAHPKNNGTNDDAQIRHLSNISPARVSRAEENSSDRRRTRSFVARRLEPEEEDARKREPSPQKRNSGLKEMSMLLDVVMSGEDSEIAGESSARAGRSRIRGKRLSKNTNALDRSKHKDENPNWRSLSAKRNTFVRNVIASDEETEEIPPPTEKNSEKSIRNGGEKRPSHSNSSWGWSKAKDQSSDISKQKSWRPDAEEIDESEEYDVTEELSASRRTDGENSKSRARRLPSRERSTNLEPSRSRRSSEGKSARHNSDADEKSDVAGERNSSEKRNSQGRSMPVDKNASSARRKSLHSRTQVSRDSEESGIESLTNRENGRAQNGVSDTSLPGVLDATDTSVCRAEPRSTGKRKSDDASQERRTTTWKGNGTGDESNEDQSTGEELNEDQRTGNKSQRKKDTFQECRTTTQKGNGAGDESNEDQRAGNKSQRKKTLKTSVATNKKKYNRQLQERFSSSKKHAQQCTDNAGIFSNRLRVSSQRGLKNVESRSPKSPRSASPKKRNRASDEMEVEFENVSDYPRSPKDSNVPPSPCRSSRRSPSSSENVQKSLEDGDTSASSVSASPRRSSRLSASPSKSLRKSLREGDASAADLSWNEGKQGLKTSKSKNRNQRKNIKFAPKNKKTVLKRTNEDLERSEAETALRRSKRHRLPVLDYWRNERVCYKYTPEGLCVDHVEPGMSPFNPFKHKKRKKRSKAAQWKKMLQRHNLSIHNKDLLPEDFEDLAEEKVPVLDVETGEEVEMDVVKRYEGLQWTSEQNEEANPDDPLTVAILYSGPALIVGQLVLQSFAEKPMQTVSVGITMVFHMMYGKVKVTLCESSFILETGDTVNVPEGNAYSIVNLRKDAAKMFYVVQRLESIEDGDDDNSEEV